MGPRSLWIAVTAVLVFGVLILLAYQRSQPGPAAEQPQRQQIRVRESNVPETPARRVAAGSNAPPGKRNVTKVSAEQRAQLEAAIKEARAGAGTASEQPGPTPENIREQVAEAVPLLAECYEQERERTPNAAGTLEVRFTIDGEPGVGGLVSSFEVVGGELAQQTTFTTCIRETLYTLKFPAPQAGGTTTVDYPLVFASK